MKTIIKQRLPHKQLFQTLIVALYLCLNCFGAKAQINYFYDANGNRTEQMATIYGPMHKVGGDTTKNDSINNIAKIHGINVYPNPTSRQVSVAIANLQSCEFAMVSLMDASGNVLQTHNATQSPVQMSLASNNQGVYYIRVVLCGVQLYYKVIKVSPGNSKAVPPAAVVK